MEEMNWEDEMTAEVLADRYGIEAESVEQVPMGTDTVNWRVVTSSGQRLYAKEYPATADLEAARAAWDMSEFCRAARLPVPRVWPDRAGNLLSLTDGRPWALVDEAPGSVATSAMTVARAEHVGMVLGRMHRVLAAYPLPRLRQHARWRTGSIQGALARCDTVLDAARDQQRENLGALRSQIAQRREDLHAHANRLRAALPEELVEQALHGDFTRTNQLVLGDAVTAVIDFRAARALPAWELGRASCDPRTIASSEPWADCILAMVAAYRSERAICDLMFVSMSPDRVTVGAPGRSTSTPLRPTRLGVYVRATLSGAKVAGIGSPPPPGGPPTSPWTAPTRCHSASTSAAAPSTCWLTANRWRASAAAWHRGGRTGRCTSPSPTPT
ncbi:phosphotransferase enzyme family protein [Streptomyces sp. NBC_01233]|uniref:phosphotransferase enzyme family protein n=1 Tax=Streptomyces sp. NBC_01233 TaxID=2903787 RepID=UPI002E161D1C|nr:phosphotransferase [Streptomyces sp. NBC_01233]